MSNLFQQDIAKKRKNTKKSLRKQKNYFLGAKIRSKAEIKRDLELKITENKNDLEKKITENKNDLEKKITEIKSDLERKIIESKNVLLQWLLGMMTGYTILLIVVLRFFEK